MTLWNHCKTSVDRVSRFKQVFHGVDPEISSYDLHFRRHYYFAFLLCASESLKIPKHVLLGSFPVFCIPGISYMYFFDIAVLRYSGDKKFDYLFFDKKRFENRYNVTAISPRLLYLFWKIFLKKSNFWSFKHLLDAQIIFINSWDVSLQDARVWRW